MRKELKRNDDFLSKIVVSLERVMGVEPTRPAWKAGILPLNYTRGTVFIVSLQDVFVKHFFV